MLKPVFIKATTIEDAWFQSIYKILDHGKIIPINKGSFENNERRLQLDFYACQITNPGFPKDRKCDSELLPKIPSQYNIPNPVSDDYCLNYMNYILSGKREKGEDYTYGERLNKYYMGIEYIGWIEKQKSFFHEYPIKNIAEDSFLTTDYYLNQIDLIIKSINEKGPYSNQYILQIAEPKDILLKDPPCLRSISIKYIDNKLNFYPYFRSWDLWAGHPINLTGIQILKEYISLSTGLEDGEIICFSDGIHIYEYVWEYAKLISNKQDLILS